MRNCYGAPHLAQKFSDGILPEYGAPATHSLVFETCPPSNAIDQAVLSLIALQQKYSWNRSESQQPAGEDATIAAFAVKFESVMSIYPARQMEEKATEQILNDLQQNFAGIGSETLNTGIFLKLVEAKLHRGAPFHAQALVDCLNQKSAENDQKNHSLTVSGAAEFAASVVADVEQVAVVLTLEAAAEIVAHDEIVRYCQSMTLTGGSSSFLIDQWIETAG